MYARDTKSKIIEQTANWVIILPFMDAWGRKQLKDCSLSTGSVILLAQDVLIMRFRVTEGGIAHRLALKGRKWGTAQNFDLQPKAVLTLLGMLLC